MGNTHTIYRALPTLRPFASSNTITTLPALATLRNYHRRPFHNTAIMSTPAVKSSFDPKDMVCPNFSMPYQKYL